MQTITNVFCKKGRFLLDSSKDSCNFAKNINKTEDKSNFFTTMKSDKIRHSGIVEAVEGGLVKVRILQTSACSSCKVAGHCSAAESKEKIVDVRLQKGSADFSVGDAVVVSTSQSAVSKALAVGFVLPFFVMVVSLFVVLALTSDEVLAAIVALASLVPYYLIIYILGGRISLSVTFGIEKGNY